MENEGIMGLPEGQAMQNQGPATPPVYVSSADTYDAALTALGASSNDPAQAEAVRQAVRESIDELDLSPTELTSLLEILEYMSQKPDEYPQIRQRLIEMGLMDDDDLPEAYDPAYLGMAIMALNEYQAVGVQGAQAPMDMAPTVEGLEPMAMAEGGLADMAKYLASRGRNGDSILAHITPGEARLLKSMGGSGTLHPETGLPQFFLKKLFKGIKKTVKKLLKNKFIRIIAMVALAAVLGPAAISAAGAMTGAATVAAGTAGAAVGLGGTTIALSTTAAAAASAAAAVGTSAAISAMAGEKINAKNLLVTAATSYFGAGGTVAGVNPVSSIAKFAGKIPGVTEGGKLAQGIGAGVTSAGIGKLAGMGTEEALGMGLQSGVMAGMSYKPPSADQLQEVSVTGKRVPVRTQAGQAQRMPGMGQENTPLDDAMASANQQARDAGAPGMTSYGAGAPGMTSYGAAPGAAPATSAIEYRPAGTRYGMGGLDIEGPDTRPRFTAYNPDLGGSLTQTPAGAPGSNAFGRVGSYLKSLAPGGEEPTYAAFRDAFLVNPDAAKGSLTKYVPGIATGLALTGALGGFKAGKVNENPLFDRKYTGSDYIRDNPDLFKSAVQPTTLRPYNSVVETPSYGLGQLGSGPASADPSTVSTLPISPTPTYMPPPGAVTNMPGGVPQPYNVSGLYGVPLLYGNPVQQTGRPSSYAQGGAVNNAIRAMASNPVNVAQTEAMLFSGPQAAQQAGMAVRELSRQGIMGAQGLRKGGPPTKFPRKTGPIDGPGTGTSDSIPAMLSDGEFVFTAKAVRNAGKGSRRKGARRMYKLMKMLEGGNVKG